MFMPVLLAGCYEDFTPKTFTTPVLCLNSLITAGQPIVVNVSHTWLYSDGNTNSEHKVSDATVTVYANGKIVDSGYLPAQGDKIKIEAESPTYGKADAEVTVPRAVIPVKLRVHPELTAAHKAESDEPLEMSANISFNISFEMDLADDTEVVNYYKVSHTGFFHSGNLYDEDDPWGWPSPPYSDFNPGSLKYEAEPIFSEHIGVFESIMGGDSYGFTFFTDRQFSGSEYTLHLRFLDCSYMVRSEKWDEEFLDCGYVITLHTVSKSYYDWANYLWQRDNGPLEEMGQIGLGEPLWGYSNVSTGAGVVAAEASVSFTVNLDEFLGKAISELK